MARKEVIKEEDLAEELDQEFDQDIFDGLESMDDN